MAIGRGRVMARGGKLWLDYDDETGRRRRQSTGLSVGQEKQAATMLRGMLAKVREGAKAGGPLTLEGFGEEWITRRKEAGIASADEDASRLRLYVLPRWGNRRLDEVTLADVRGLLADLAKRKSRKGGTLAPRTIRLVYGTLQALYADAMEDELVTETPCRLRRGRLPRREDKDPEWRDTAVFSREEVELLISHPDLPLDRRVAYGLLAMAGLRWGELAALRWRHYDAEVEPLGRLRVAVSYRGRTKEIARTKTRAVRAVPVHSALAKLLGEWKLATGAGADDLIIPPTGRAKSKHRTSQQGLRALLSDLAALGLRERRSHDWRRTMITLAQDGGAIPEVVRQITHAKAGADVLESYTTRAWETLCGAIRCIGVERREGRVLTLRAAAGGGEPGTPLAHSEGLNEKPPQIRRLAGAKLAGDTGFESVAGTLHDSARLRKNPGFHAADRVPADLTVGPDLADSGAGCARCARADPESAILAMLPEDPAAARALLLRVLTRLG